MHITRRDFLAYSSLMLPAFYGCSSRNMYSGKEDNQHLNVLFIAVDDLRCNLGCYGDKLAKTPNIDRLAKRGMVFENAYCQQAVCNPSRASLITGRRPDTTKVWDLRYHFRDSLPDVVTLPQFFKNQGYESRSIGKILHGTGRPSKDPISWSIDPIYSSDYGGPKQYKKYVLQENSNPKGGKGVSVECVDVEDDVYADGCICEAAIDALKDYKQSQKPFFLAVGFHKPHLPFCAPKKYWDMYDRDVVAKPATDNLPDGAPHLSGHNSPELRGYTDIPEQGRLSAEKTAELRHGYYAATSYTDAQIGKLIDTLDELDMTGNTVIVMFGDHGWHIGEHGLWGKITNFEVCTRSPLLCCAPGYKSGRKTKALVEFVDIYPSLLELCGFDLPQDLEGLSFKPLLKKPSIQWKKGAFSQFQRAYDPTATVPLNLWKSKSLPEIMGYSVRAQRYRYTEWQDFKTKQVLASELYDYRNDPNETINVVSKAQYSSIAVELSALLNGGYKTALPEK